MRQDQCGNALCKTEQRCFKNGRFITVWKVDKITTTNEWDKTSYTVQDILPHEIN